MKGPSLAVSTAFWWDTVDSTHASGRAAPNTTGRRPKRPDTKVYPTETEFAVSGLIEGRGAGSL